MGTSEEMAGGSLAERCDAHQQLGRVGLVVVRVALDPRAARTGHLDPIALDGSFHRAAPPVLLEEGVEVGK